MKLNMRSKLLLSFASLILIPTISIGAISYDSAKNKVEKQIMQSSTSEVKFLNEDIHNLIQSKISDVNHLSNTLSNEKVDNQKDKALIPILAQYANMHNDTLAIYLVTEKGIVAEYPQKQMSGNADPKKLSWYREAMENPGKAIISDAFLSSSKKNTSITIAETTADGKGVVGIDVDLSTLRTLASSSPIGKEGYAVIVDQNNRAVIHPTIKTTDDSGDWSKPMLTSESGQYAYLFQGKNKELYFETNKETGWKICGTIYTSEITDAASTIFNVTLRFIILFGILATVLAYFIVNSVAKPLAKMAEQVKRVAEGDLTLEPLQIKNKDEVGILANGFGIMVGNLKKLIHEINLHSNQVAASSEQLTASAEQASQSLEQVATSIQEVAAGSDKQARSLEETAKTMDEMASGVQQIAANAQIVTSTAEKTSEMVSDGNKAIKSAIQKMNNIKNTVDELAFSVRELGNQSELIGQIINVITNISAQTNLLALNAAIEAARAGEQGRGFAVVADEVRKLAEQSSGSAKQIDELVKTIQGRINMVVQSTEKGTQEVIAGMGAVNVAGESFAQIRHFVQEVTSQIQEVSGAVQQIAMGTDQVVSSIDILANIAETSSTESQSVSAATEEQLASMEEITAAATALSKMAEELQTATGRFEV
jgi:methyl-accepting chemotaxis protein